MHSGVLKTYFSLQILMLSNCVRNNINMHQLVMVTDVQNAMFFARITEIMTLLLGTETAIRGVTS